MRQNNTLFFPAFIYSGFVIKKSMNEISLGSMGSATTLSSSIFVFTSAFVNRIAFSGFNPVDQE